MTESRQKTGGVPRVWRFIASMRFGLVIMFLLAGAAALGVLLPQGDPANQADTWNKLRSYLGFDQIFNAWWFIALACLLGINVFACVFNRVGAVLHVFRYPQMRINAFERLEFNQTFELMAGINEIAKSISQVLLAAHYRVMQNSEQEQIMFYGDKHRAAILGPVLSHLGALILIAGVIWGGYTAYQGEVAAIPGASFSLAGIATRGTGGLIDPNLNVQVNQPKNTAEPKSNMSIVEDGNTVLTGDVGYNSPLVYNDVSIHLVKYDPGILVNIDYQNKTIPVVLTSTGQNHTQLPGNEGLVVVWTNVNTRQNRPSVDFTLAQGGSLVQQGHLELGSLASPMNQLSISLEGYRGIYDLRAVKNPGQGLVMGGAAMLILGMFVSLLLARRKVWISLIPEGEQVLVKAGGYGRLKLEFAAEFKALLEDIKSLPGG